MVPLKLGGQAHSQRQEEFTKELLDVFTGTEAILARIYANTHSRKWITQGAPVSACHSLSPVPHAYKHRC